ncbi:MAG: ABC transporter ATP-binding protein [Actinobacteria bacterium]|nr:ABC transporter ATP-binding protein [Actinomycetota bacterium]
MRKRFGDVQAVDDVGFTIAAGETYGLLGPNGAGKTTTISMVCGLLEPDAGDIAVAGQPMSPRARAAKAHVGYVPQDLAIYPDLSARENLTFFARLHGVPGRELSRRVDAVLELIGLEQRARDRTSDYSGGMKRRLNIGIGLLHEPTLLVLDEPTVGVDPQSRNAILESVATLRDEGMGVLYTTHYMEEAERLCDRIGIIDAGRLQAEGTRRELVGMIGEADRLRLVASGDLVAAAAVLDRSSYVSSTHVDDDGLDVVLAGAGQHLPAVLAEVATTGVSVTAVSVIEPDLESVFLHLTGRGLRD